MKRGGASRFLKRWIAMCASILICCFLCVCVLKSGVAQQNDTTPPELVSFDFTPKSIDTRYGPQDVEITLHATDSQTGISSVDVIFESPSGEQGVAGLLLLLAGTVYDGIWKGLATFPQYSVGGTWRIREVRLEDAASHMMNMLVLDTSGLEARGFQAHLEVISQLQPDTIPPELTSLDIEPTSIDTRYGSQDVEMTFSVSDDLAGVLGIDLYWASPSGYGPDWIYDPS